jgi:hypothetical protein
LLEELWLATSQESALSPNTNSDPSAQNDQNNQEEDIEVDINSFTLLQALGAGGFGVVRVGVWNRGRNTRSRKMMDERLAIKSIIDLLLQVSPFGV